MSGAYGAGYTFDGEGLGPASAKISISSIDLIMSFCLIHPVWPRTIAFSPSSSILDLAVHERI